MNFMNSDEFNQKHLGSGLFGAVYHYGDKAIKQYHIILYKHDMKNPSLRLNRKKFKLMKMRSSKIKHTPLVEDLLYINNEFSGVVYPYVEGQNLGVLLDTLTINEKQNFSKQIIRNAKELTDNHIYPRDYRLSNIIKDKNGNVQILDTDDALTKVTLFSNPLYLSSSLKSLKKVLIELLEDDDYFYNTKSSSLQKYIETSKIMKQSLITYENLTEYVDKKTEPFKTIFINVEDLNSIEDLNVNKIDIITMFANCNVVLVSKNFNQTILNDLLQENINIYDYLDFKDNDLNDSLDKYLKTHNITKSLLLDKNELEDDTITTNTINYLKDGPKLQKNKNLVKKL